MFKCAMTTTWLLFGAPLIARPAKKIIYTWNNTFVHTLLSRIYLSVFIVGRLHWKRLLFFQVPHKVSEVPPAIYHCCMGANFFFLPSGRNETKSPQRALRSASPYTPARRVVFIIFFVCYFNNNIGKVKAHLTGFQPWFKYLNIFGDKLRQQRAS